MDSEVKSHATCAKNQHRVKAEGGTGIAVVRGLTEDNRHVTVVVPGDSVEEQPIKE